MVPNEDIKAYPEYALTYLREITRGWDDLGEPVRIELRCLFPGRKPDISRFSPDEAGISALVQHAVVMNGSGLNCYVVVNPVRASAPLRRDGKLSGAFDEDIPAAFNFWADGDDETAAASIRNFAGPKYTMAVTTGRVPSPRPHIYWRCEDAPIRNLEAWSGIQRAIAARLSTDSTVVNPSRIMRLPGTVNWPTDQKRAKGRIAELVTIRTEYEDDREPVSFDQMLRAFGSLNEGQGKTADKGTANGTFEFDTGRPDFAAKFADYLRQCGTDGEKHAGVRGVSSMLGARNLDIDLVAALIRHVCPVWDANVENLIRSAYRFAPEDDAPAGKGGIEPVDLWGVFKPPVLRAGLLPKVIEEFAFTQAQVMGADPGGLAAAALCVACAAIPDAVRIRVKKADYWTESARIWVALVGDPSTKKSPILSAAERPLKRIDAKLYKEFIRKKADYDALKKDEKAEAERPRQLRRRLEDTTIEAAQEVMSDSPDGVLVVQDELSGWFGGMDRYSNGKGRDRSFWLQAFNGGSYAFNRIGRGAGIVENLSACVLGGIQPEPIRKIVAEASDDGLIQRLFPIVLQAATLGDEDMDSSEVVSAFELLVDKLTRCEVAPAGRIATGEPVSLIFDAEAQLLRRRLEQRHLELMSVEVVNRKLAAHIGKYDGLFARLCVAFHCIDSGGGMVPSVIGIDTARRAANFLHTFLMPHAVCFYGGVLDLSDDHDRLTAVASYILAHGLEQVSVRDVARGVSSMRKLTRGDTMRVFEQLEALGWVAPSAGTNRMNATPTWVVNPEVHKRFTERRDVEVERREQARANLKEAVKWRS